MLQTASPESPLPRRLRWWDLVFPVLSGGAVLAAVTLGITLLALGNGGMDFAKDIARRMSSADQGYGLNMGTMAVIYLPPLFVMAWITRAKGLRYFTPVARNTIYTAFGGGIAFVLGFQLVMSLLIYLGAFTFTSSPAELAVVPKSLTQLGLGLAVAAVLGPLVEEFYFRGFLLSYCRGKMPVIAATVLNGVLFGIVHFYFLQHQGLGGIVVTTAISLFGMLNVWWTLRTKSLWPAFASHAAYNGASLIAAYLLPGIV